MKLLNQPYDGSLGELLKKEIASDYTELNIFTAFAKNSGVLKLKDSLEEFKNKKRIINVFVGVDLYGTSKEALLNLLDVTTNLIVVHSENNNTFHSKIYSLHSKNQYWCAVGSNNLTLGGLWNNFESSIIINGKDNSTYESVINLKKRYMDESYGCSFKINTKEDIEKLFVNGYLLSETEIFKQILGKNKSKNQNKEKMFGTEKASYSSKKNPQLEIGSENSNVIKKVNDDKEIFWYEMKSSTGGSRNILDLSKIGKLVEGSTKNTIYEIPGNKDNCMGGILFFDIKPEDIYVEKNIKINFKGNDYYPSTILYPTGKKLMVLGESS